VAALLVTAPDVELPAMLKSTFQRAMFTTAGHLRAVLTIKPGAMVIVLDESQSELVTGLRRTDIRAVALVTPGTVPVIFRPPVVAVVERPLQASRLVAAIHQAIGDLGP
jgi:hypothetical protein